MRINLLVALSVATATMVIYPGVFKRFVKNAQHRGVPSYDYHTATSIDAVDSVPVQHVESQKQDKVTIMRKEHLQELHTQKKLIEHDYAQQAEALVNERVYLATELAQERLGKKKHEQREHELVQKVSRLERELTASRAHAQELAHQVHKKEADRIQAFRDYDELVDKHDALCDHITQLEKDKEGLALVHKQRYEQQLANLKQENGLLKTKIHALDERYQKTVGIVVAKDSDLAIKDTHIAQLGKELRSTRERTAHLEHHVKELTQTINHERLAKAEARDDIKQLEHSQQEMRVAHNGLKKECAELKDQLLKAQLEHDVTRKKHEPLASDFQLTQHASLVPHK